MVDEKKYFFHLLPSGMIYPNCLGIIGNGVVLNIPGLFKEIDDAASKGLTGMEKRLRISNRCHVVLDVHQLVDGLEEERRGTGLIGTTKKGIGPAYSSKVTRNGIRMCDVVGDWDYLVAKYTELVKYAKRRYPNLEIDISKSLEQFVEYRKRLSGMVCDTITLVNERTSDPNCSVLIEGAQSCLLDIDFGTYPFVTSSNCSIGGACTGLGLPPSRIGPVYGVMKAYTTRVGSGGFPTELHDGLAKQLQEVGQEFGVTTGRRRRVGWLDSVVVRYSHMINNFSALAMTKLDVLDGLKEVLIGRAYLDPETGLELKEFPADQRTMERLEVVYETLPGWSESTRGCKSFDALPTAAQQYVLTAERLCGVHIRWIGTGASRDAIIDRGTLNGCA
ncbi:unnamed protein product [Calicophoron daubneyi]